MSCRQVRNGNASTAGIPTWKARGLSSPGVQLMGVRASSAAASRQGGDPGDPVARGGSSGGGLPPSSSAGSAKATCVPAPVLASTYPSARSCSKALTIVLRETPSSAASSREDGSRIPDVKRRARMASRTS